MDFGFGNGGDNNAGKGGAPNGTDNNGQVTNLTDGKPDNNLNGEPADDINSISDSGDPANPKPNGGGGFDNGDGNTNNPPKPAAKPDENKGGDNNDNTNNNGDASSDLEEGAIIELGDDKYTVDAQGNLLDKDGGIFKEAKDVKDWLDTFDVAGDDTDLSIENIRNVVGIDITDENDQPIAFENTPVGVKAYIDAVLEAGRDEHYTEAYNTLNEKYPIINDVINYWVANGNSLDGFGEVPDRSNITIDDANEAQHESIIRTAWTEQGKRGDVETYINYLKSSGILLATAKEDLAALQESDAQYKEELADKAEKAETKRAEQLEAYWKGVKEVIDNKSIAGYQIPDTIIINKGGKKISATPDDFYNYMYRKDKDGVTEYQKELAKTTPETRRDDEVLRAYLRFVGGNYSNLVDMAVNKQKINTIKIQSKNKTAASVKILKPNTNANKGGNTDFGY